MTGTQSPKLPPAPAPAPRAWPTSAPTPGPWPGELRPVSILATAFPSADSLLAALISRRDGSGGLAIRTRVRLPVGEPVVVEVACPGLAHALHVRARVARPHAAGRLEVAFDRDQRHVQQFLLWFAAGKLAPVQPRRHRRYGCSLPVKWRPFGEVALRDGWLDNLSAGGALLRAVRGVRDGAPVVMRVRAELVGELVLTGTVLSNAPDAEGPTAMRVRFSHEAPTEARDLRRLLRAFGSRGVVVSAPW